MRPEERVAVREEGSVVWEEEDRCVVLLVSELLVGVVLVGVVLVGVLQFGVVLVDVVLASEDVSEAAGGRDVYSPNLYSTFGKSFVASMSKPHRSPLNISMSAVIPPPSFPFLNSATTTPLTSTNLVPSSVVCLFLTSSSKPIFRMILMAEPRMSIDWPVVRGVGERSRMVMWRGRVVRVSQWARVELRSRKLMRFLEGPTFQDLVNN